MFLVRVILLSYIAFTVTSAACCGENKDRCQDDCTGIICIEDSHCGDQCCIGDSHFFKGYCGACHKTRHCKTGFFDFCSDKCCGINDDYLQCLKTCHGMSCFLDEHCDGDCCLGDAWNKTCGRPCPKTKGKPFGRLLTLIIAISITIAVLSVVARILHVYLKRRRAERSHTTTSHPVALTVDNGARPIIVTYQYHKVDNVGKSSGVAL